MKKMMTFLKKAKVKAFTLVEMLVVLLIISVLLLLFVPNLTKQKEAVNDKGKAAVVKVVESQAELYNLAKNEDASLSKLQADGRITETNPTIPRKICGKLPMIWVAILLLSSWGSR